MKLQNDYCTFASVMKTTEAQNLGPPHPLWRLSITQHFWTLAHRPIRAHLLFMLLWFRSALLLRPPPRPANSERHFVCGHHHFFFFLNHNTPASRRAFTLRMQKLKPGLRRCTLSLRCGKPAPAYQSLLFDAPRRTPVSGPCAQLPPV